jgi:Uma2 family endonuclease
LPPPFDALAALPLVETDGEPLETPWHRMEINLLIEAITCRFRDRDDFYVGGIMFIYYSAQQVRSRDYKGPDFFFVDGADRHRPRQWWAIWEEQGRYPDVIIELLSESTAEEDRTTKKAIYERTFQTREYFLYEPETEVLEGWRLNAKGRYRRIAANKQGRLWSEKLQLWLGTWDGVFQGQAAIWLRFFDADGNLVHITAEEEQIRAAQAKRRAQAQKRRADAEKKRADAEKKRADAEKQRADAAEAEAARLRRELEALRRQAPSPSDEELEE